ncbi:hypothetical protein [Pseudomonas chlororaphis]|uniref:hypothetical protein n=1 Tax=Pseudomonas chlororaphis TaxID=587753 RepID=UPI00026E45D9|nr:hypothetical protein [Pseudomonas chlororaphis]EJL07392.1 UbiE/COQ5 methyltransferase [Pseudomonas chlororaphis subsp. aureofaciens 30-84]
MAEQNAYQVADWNGQSGEYWVANQARLDAMLAVFGQAAIETAAPATGERVLDVLTAAGFTDIAIAPFDASIPFGEGRTRRSTTR